MDAVLDLIRDKHTRQKVEELVKRLQKTAQVQIKENIYAASPQDTAILTIKHPRLPEFSLVLVQGGEFTMGDDKGDDDEKPAHKVVLDSFFVFQFPLTQDLYEAVMGKNPSSFKGPRRPVENINWYDSVKFCKKLNNLLDLDSPIVGDGDEAKLNLSTTGFRLLTEAEWEFAARGGIKSKGFKFAGSNVLSELGWYGDNADDGTRSVGLKFPNELGIYDMSGNVWEWCWDWYDRDFYKHSPEENPVNNKKAVGRMLRGGSWSNDADFCRVANRSYLNPDTRYYILGARPGLAFSS